MHVCARCDICENAAASASRIIRTRARSQTKTTPGTAPPKKVECIHIAVAAIRCDARARQHAVVSRSSRSSGRRSVRSAAAVAVVPITPLCTHIVARVVCRAAHKTNECISCAHNLATFFVCAVVVAAVNPPVWLQVQAATSMRRAARANNCANVRHVRAGPGSF